jgi:hypothetical protein
MQKACEFEKMDGPNCNKAALELLKKMNQNPESETEKKSIWKGLDQFKNLS